MNQIDTEELPIGRVGYVALVGRPNAGKSTFINQALNYHLAAVSSRPQTTRCQWRGILSDAVSQIIFTDLPGMHVGNTALDQAMLKTIDRNLRDADVIVVIADPSRSWGEEDTMVAQRVAASGKAPLLALNKSDISSASQRELCLLRFREVTGLESVDCGEISALTGANIDALIGVIRERLPTGPFLYPPDQITDAFERHIAAELIREAVLDSLFDELPYSIAINIQEWHESDTKIKIKADIYTEREAHKPIIIGENGSKIAAIRGAAVKILRENFGKFIDLRLYVKVAKDWRNRPGYLKELGLAG